MPLIGDDGLKKIDNLLLPSGHDVELPAHLREAVIHVRAKVDEVLSQGIKTRRGGPAEIANVGFHYLSLRGSFGRRNHRFVGTLCRRAASQVQRGP